MSKLKYLIVVAFLFSGATVQAQSKDDAIFIDFGDEKDYQS